MVALFALALGVVLLLTSLLQVPSIILRTGVFSLLIVIVLSDALFEFGTTSGGAWLSISIIILAITLGLIFFLRAHINKILITVFAVMFVSTILINSSLFKNELLIETSSPTNQNNLPVIVHLILDEHMGTGGMTAKLPGGEVISKELKTFYVNNGFRLFSLAYSEYFDTHASIATILNQVNEVGLSDVKKYRNKYLLSVNHNFEHWSRAGYKINILQSSYFDFCTSKHINYESCTTYPHDSFDAKTVSLLPLTERISLVGNMYLSSMTVFKLIRLSKRKLNHYLTTKGLPRVNMELWHGRVGPLAVSTPLEQWIKKISRSNGGELFFAHLLMPHYPYVYDSSCVIRTPISSWKLRTLIDGTNTAKSRQTRYIEYFNQIRCGMIKLLKLFDAMRKSGTFEGATIIIHGDHGARITRIKMLAHNAEKMTVDDFIDGFSTLFAFKTPGQVPQVDQRMLALPKLLSYTQSKDKNYLVEDTSPQVFLLDDNGRYVKTQIPAFPVSPQ